LRTAPKVSHLIDVRSGVTENGAPAIHDLLDTPSGVDAVNTRQPPTKRGGGEVLKRRPRPAASRCGTATSRWWVGDGMMIESGYRYTCRWALRFPVRGNDCRVTFVKS
jgi:hypothetical protein